MITLPQTQHRDFFALVAFLSGATGIKNCSDILYKLNGDPCFGKNFKKSIAGYLIPIYVKETIRLVRDLHGQFNREFFEVVPSCLGGFSCCGGDQITVKVNIFDLSNFFSSSKYKQETFFHQHSGGKAREKVAIDLNTNVFIELNKWLLEVMKGNEPDSIEIRSLNNPSMRWFVREWVSKVFAFYGVPDNIVKIKNHPDKTPRLHLSVSS